jgi:septum formation protein
MAERLALEKASAVAHRIAIDRAAKAQKTIILGADTVVIAGDRQLGKPIDEADAVAMLRQLGGRTHEVITGVALVNPTGGERSVSSERTRVHLRALSDDDIARYVATRDPLDKAGAYAIQNEQFHLVEWIDGCYSNVVGLPLCLVAKMLRQHGVEVRSDWSGDGPSCKCAGIVMSALP